ncbi:MAG: DUF4097 family beta strand repeat protein [bacterium]|nr:DUF4097 family beta strand repeat protein [bacterium]
MSLENINGNVEFEVWGAQEVRVLAVKEASSQKRLDGLKVEVQASGDSIVIDTEYPSSRSRGWFGGDKGHAKVTYTITVPTNARLRDVELVNGRLEITGVEGGVEASTVNGRIGASALMGTVELETVNGRIEADCGNLSRGDHVRLESVNGTIELYLPGSASARLDVETVNGSIKNDFGIEVKKGKWVGRSMSGDIGGGDVPIDISTVNGSIRVFQR